MQRIPTGQELQAARERAGLSTVAVARAAGLTDHSHLRKIERKEIEPNAATLRKVVNAIADLEEEREHADADRSA